MNLLNERGFSRRAHPLFCKKAKELLGLTSLFRRRKDIFKTLPVIGDCSGILATMNRMDPEFEALAAELGQLKTLTDFKFRLNSECTRRMNVDELNDELVESVAEAAELAQHLMLR